jgi:methyl-accepting chemotaxis protein
MKLKISSIRGKIVFLSLLGIMGMCFITGINYYFANSMEKDQEIGTLGQRITCNILEGSVIEKDFLSSGNKTLLKPHQEIHERLETDLTRLNFLVEGKLVTISKEISQIQKTHKKVFQSVVNTMGDLEKDRQKLSELSSDVNSKFSEIVRAIEEEEALLVITDQTIGAEKKNLQTNIKDVRNFMNESLLNLQDLFVFSNEAKYIEKTEEIATNIKLKKDNILKILSDMDDKEYDKTWKESEVALKAVSEVQTAIFQIWKANSQLMARLKKSGKEIQNKAMEIAGLSIESVKKSQKVNEYISIVISFAGVVILILFSVIIIGSITRPLNRAVKGLREGSEQVASGADEVSSSSQSLAEGASEQAASIEETSSSMEEMSSMTKQNAGNAREADGLMKEVGDLGTQANNSMEQLTESMAEIQVASEETSKIIKTIDEIAFQTNLLALNAAVEAARAGEAGAGFAVVADEVRNLAMRAAEAAKNTAELIEGTVKKVHEGSGYVTQTSEAFVQLNESAVKVGELVSEIAAASDEQAQGIEQINRAVSEMDKVVQQVAANAEESASASEEMSAQSLEMKATVNELSSLVSGKGASKPAVADSRTVVRGKTHSTRKPERPEAGKKMLPEKSARSEDPAKVLPLDDEDFKDF